MQFRHCLRIASFVSCNLASHNNQVYSHKLSVSDCRYFVVSVFLIWTLIDHHGTMLDPADQIEVYKWKMSSIWISTVVENDYKSQRNSGSNQSCTFESYLCVYLWSDPVEFHFDFKSQWSPVSSLFSPNVILSVISAVIFYVHLLHQTPQRQILNPRKDTQMQLGRKIEKHENQLIWNEHSMLHINNLFLFCLWKIYIE